MAGVHALPAPSGLCTCAASPSRKQRPSRKRSARAMLDAVGSRPAALLESKLRPGFVPQGGDRLLEREIVALP